MNCKRNNDQHGLTKASVQQKDMTKRYICNWDIYATNAKAFSFIIKLANLTKDTASEIITLGDINN